MIKGIIHAFLVLSTVCLTYALEGWESDIEKASAKAKEENKDLLIAYKGEGWDPEGWGKPERQFTGKDFMDIASAKYVLLVQPLPEKMLKSDDKGTKATRLVFADSRGYPYYTYSSGLINGPAWFAEKIKSADVQRNKIIGLVNSLLQAQGDDFIRLAGTLHESLAPTLFALNPQYSAWIETARDHDEDDIGGFSARERSNAKSARMLMVNMAYVNEVFSEYRNTPDEEKEPFEEFCDRMLDEMMRDKDMDFFSKAMVAQTVLLASGQKKVFPSDNFDEYKEHLKKRMEKIKAFYEVEGDDGKVGLWLEQFCRPALYSVYLIRDLSSKTTHEECFAIIERARKSNHWEPLQQQLFLLFEGVFYIRTGEIDTGLEQLKKGRDMVPWASNAGECNRIMELVAEKKGEVLTLAEQSKKGDAESTAKLKELTAVRLGVDVVMD